MNELGALELYHFVPFKKKPNLVDGMVFEWGTQFVSSSTHIQHPIAFDFGCVFCASKQQASYLRAYKTKENAIKQCLDVLSKMPKLGGIFNGLEEEEEEEEEVTNISNEFVC
jgi:hypothetical protein